jgi:hypothetical protein
MRIFPEITYQFKLNDTDEISLSRLRRRTLTGNHLVHIKDRAFVGKIEGYSFELKRNRWDLFSCVGNIQEGKGALSIRYSLFWKRYIVVFFLMYYCSGIFVFTWSEFTQTEGSPFSMEIMIFLLLCPVLWFIIILNLGMRDWANALRYRVRDVLDTKEMTRMKNEKSL